MNRERPADLTIAAQKRPYPQGADTKRCKQVPLAPPVSIVGDVGQIYGRLLINRRPHRPAVTADTEETYLISETGAAWSGSTVNLVSAVFRQPDRTQSAVSLRLRQSSDFGK